MDILGFINQVVDGINGFVWGPIMLVLLVGTGVYITFRTGFLQIRKLPLIMRKTFGAMFKRNPDKNAISPFQAVSAALAGTIGVGNIAGVSTAITLGGPGAIFWMWVSGFFGMATKYAEVVLAVKFRERRRDGYTGGPMYYLEKGLGMKWLGVIFAVLCTLASFGIGNLTQSNTIALSVEESFGLSPLVTGLVVAFLAGIVILGGTKRIVSITEKLVPIMALFYIVSTLYIVILNIADVPAVLSSIFTGAFSPVQLGAGVAGYTVSQAIRYGVARGVFTNEAGLGSAPIAHATAETKSPVEQGFWGVFEVFVDTIVCCTLTALVVLLSGKALDPTLDGAALTSAAFVHYLGPVGGQLLTIAIIFFAFSTILGWSLYGERSLQYLNDRKSVTYLYRLCYIGAIVAGAMGKIGIVWSLSDAFNGMMAIPNLIGVLGLSGIVFAETKKYFSKRI